MDRAPTKSPSPSMGEGQGEGEEGQKSGDEIPSPLRGIRARVRGHTTPMRYHQWLP